MTPEAIAQEAQNMIRTMGKDPSGSPSLKQIFNRLARLTGLTDGQIKRLYYGEWNVIPAHVFETVRIAYGQHLKRAARQSAHQAAVYRVLSKEWDELCAPNTYASELHPCDGAPYTPFALPSPSSISVTASRPSLTGSNVA